MEKKENENINIRFSIHTVGNSFASINHNDILIGQKPSYVLVSINI